MLKREYCAVERYSVRWPGAVLPYGIAAKLVAMLFCVLVVRNMFSRSTNPPGVNTASPMLKEPSGLGFSFSWVWTAGRMGVSALTTPGALPEGRPGEGMAVYAAACIAPCG